MLKRWVTLSAIAFLMLATFAPLAAQQPNDGENEFRLGAVNPRAVSLDTLTASAGRGIWVADNPDLDGDGLPEIIVTEYTKGGRVFVYEVIGNDQLEFVWASKRLSETRSGGNSTPRMVTTGDFDNDGFQEIIFPIGYVATDSVEAAERGIYFYEFTGTDNDYGSEPAYHLKFEDFYAPFATINQGATESGIRVQDIDGDGKSELLFPRVRPRCSTANCSSWKWNRALLRMAMPRLTWSTPTRAWCSLRSSLRTATPPAALRSVMWTAMGLTRSS